ncbi:glycerol-3-phosphate responsive antiterminator [Bacillus cytotoxicus]|uniref:Glycerol uptake operon antiterminator regulatory protein n=1 Tax=Bacillus cytotoxicus (strain DSM 22905 / CIP 110041 / 391-98 / NVH 391-98) TaxID=315749 RepID=A7GLY5_BACCN|nr:glycerol-3-phosphate responsive antiterminator [Bacillus cytotoxicus]ABS21143.1 glycerol-3-phosphate responsive antiterminator [Bacillus cytotoxicus NVH 391-98]MDH2864037.1 glycerol-3-phosphate responsive antiterminator [Bacillus cytotoxicus]MDH2883563.1 glycerol-3-phosphate responsive antiterminator [Bacillus cytotoxicus]NZD31272.1 glycerol-3-phosphate responsive antiterminator [Bacillus cytotoxicus]HDR7212464.1 glycerol-3-phosphate responsive antiterminator [Bacillus cytotoxicus]
MEFHEQKILPAVRQIKDLEKLVHSSYEYIVILDIHIGQLKSVVKLAKQYEKKVFLHVDLIHGLQSDGHATEFLCQEYKPYGLLSTKASVIMKAKQKGVVAIQRIFLIDSSAMEKSCHLLGKTKPDYIEVLPGALTDMIAEVRDRTGIPILAGGFIRTVADVERALEAGATAITTSKKELWKHFQKK